MSIVSGLLVGGRPPQYRKPKHILNPSADKGLPQPPHVVYSDLIQTSTLPLRGLPLPLTGI
jgi:hypothetical protein